MSEIGREIKKYNLPVISHGVVMCIIGNIVDNTNKFVWC